MSGQVGEGTPTINTKHKEWDEIDEIDEIEMRHVDDKQFSSSLWGLGMGLQVRASQTVLGKDGNNHGFLATEHHMQKGSTLIHTYLGIISVRLSFFLNRPHFSWNITAQWLMETVCIRSSQPQVASFGFLGTTSGREGWPIRLQLDFSFNHVDAERSRKRCVGTSFETKKHLRKRGIGSYLWGCHWKIQFQSYI